MGGILAHQKYTMFLVESDLKDQRVVLVGPKVDLTDHKVVPEDQRVVPDGLKVVPVRVLYE